MTKTFERAAAAIVELPPASPAYVVTYEVISADSCKHLGCWVPPPEEPAHNHEHTHEGPRDPLRISVFDNLNPTETLTAVLIEKGSDAAP